MSKYEATYWLEASEGGGRRYIRYDRLRREAVLVAAGRSSSEGGSGEPSAAVSIAPDRLADFLHTAELLGFKWGRL